MNVHNISHIHFIWYYNMWHRILCFCKIESMRCNLTTKVMTHPCSLIKLRFSFNTGARRLKIGTCTLSFACNVKKFPRSGAQKENGIKCLVFSLFSPTNWSIVNMCIAKHWYWILCVTLSSFSSIATTMLQNVVQKCINIMRRNG